MIVTYTGPDEVIVTTEADERQMLEEYFGGKLGRDITEYDRADSAQLHEVVVISLRLVTEFE